MKRFCQIIIIACCTFAAISLFAVNKNSKSTIDSLIQLSNQQYYSNFEDAPAFDDHLKEAFKIAEERLNHQKQFDIYVLVAKRYREKSMYGDAIEILQRALQLANRLDDDKLKAYATHEMAVNFRRFDDNAYALKLHVQALEWAENASDTFLMHCSLNGIGCVYFEYENFPKAIDYFHQSLKFLGKEKPNILGEAINSNLLGEAWLALNNPDSALIYLDQSFKANEKIGSELGKGICHNGMGMVHQQKGNYQMAIKSYKKALAIYENIGDMIYETMCMNNLGKTYMAMKKYQLAEQTLNKSLQIAKSIGSKRHALEASQLLAELYNKIGAAKKAFNFSQQVLAYKDSITEELRQQNAEAVDIMYKAEKQEREILILKQNAQLDALKMSRQRYIFLGIAIFFILIGSVGLFTYRQRQLNNKLKEISLEQKLLRAQLNPHFVFNSLSAVQNFIMKNDKKAASQYLVNFSRLMRNILMGSGTDFILLSNELEILDDYLNLQRLRFQNKFDYFFELDPDIDPENTQVPPMLVQPFVENSIEHGVRDIDRQGVIIIRFKKQEQELFIEVEDNGKGLAEKQEAKSKKGHISMATKITRQRLQNLQNLTRRKCRLQVLDRQKVNKSHGVVIRIGIPWTEEN